MVENLGKSNCWFEDRKLTGYIEVLGLINAIDLPLLVIYFN